GRGMLRSAARDVATADHPLQQTEQRVVPGRARAEHPVARIVTMHELDDAVQVEPPIEPLAQAEHPVEEAGSPAPPREEVDHDRQDRQVEHDDVLDAVEGELQLEDREVPEGDPARSDLHGPRPSRVVGISFVTLSPTHAWGSGIRRHGKARSAPRAAPVSSPWEPAPGQEPSPGGAVGSTAPGSTPDARHRPMSPVPRAALVLGPLLLGSTVLAAATLGSARGTAGTRASASEVLQGAPAGESGRVA